MCQVPAHGIGQHNKHLLLVFALADGIYNRIKPISEAGNNTLPINSSS
jgi:hypothetical protein